MLPCGVIRHSGDTSADIRESQLEELRDGSSVMVKIPVIFRDRWQLYQTTTGAVYAFDTELLKLIDFKEASSMV